MEQLKISAGELKVNIKETEGTLLEMKMILTCLKV